MKILPAVYTLLLTCFMPVGLFAKDVLMDPFFVFSPRVMAQGGSFSAIASGHEALFTNPAGFYSKKGSLTLPSLTAWAFMDPNAEAEDLEESSASYEWMKAQSKNGFGGGAALGLSYVGRGLGLGFIGASNLLLQGEPFPGGVDGTFSTTLALVGGYARPIQLGSTRIIVGGDLRPMIRGYSNIDSAAFNRGVDAYFDDFGKKNDDLADDELYAALNGGSGNPASFALQGAGLGIDLGAKWEIGSLTLGLAVRDLFNTRFTMFRHPLGDYAQHLVDRYGLPSNADAEDAVDEYYLPMSLSFGAAYHPDLGKAKFFLDPTFHFDLVDPVDSLRDGLSPWSFIRLGAEAISFRFIRLRAGLNQSYASAGVGVKLLFLDLSASVFTTELGPDIGDRPNTGVSLEAALRF